jgi:hypothetical protein
LGVLMAVATRVLAVRPQMSPFDLAVVSYAVLLVGYMGYGDLAAPKAHGLHILVALWVAFHVLRDLFSATRDAPVSPKTALVKEPR